MKYMIKACVYGEVVDKFETDSLEEARNWWKENWEHQEGCGRAFCEWYVDGEYQEIEQKIKLEKE